MYRARKFGARGVTIVALMLVTTLPTTLLAQGPRRTGGPSLGAMEIKLTKDSVERMLAALPEITQQTSAHQAQFMGSLTGSAPAGGMPQLKPDDLKKLRAIFEKHGFTMEEFAMQVSALLATYLILSPEAFQRQLPNEEKPEVRAILTDPNIPQAQKDGIRKQIAFARENQEKIREQLRPLATPENQAVVKPLLPQVEKAFLQAEQEARKAMESSRTSPHRADNK